MRWRLVIFCLLPLALAPAHTSAEEPRSLLQTEHLRISGRVPQAWLEKAGELGEALYPVLKAHWGREPAPQRLPLELILHPDRTSFQNALVDEGVGMDLTSIGGYTTDKTRRSHVFLQGVAFETRRLILHELTHQFDDRSAMANRGRVPYWYREGLAEYFGWHRQGPKGITFGQFDVIARNHRPALMAQISRAGALNGWKVATGKAPADYTTALGVVSALLLTKDAALRSVFRDWERKHAHRAGMQRALTEACGAHADAVIKAVSDQWTGFDYPWRLPKPGFDVFGDVIVGESEPFRRLESSHDSHLWQLSAEIEVEDDARAGFFMRDADGMYALLEVGPKKVRLLESGSLSGQALVVRQQWDRKAGKAVLIRLAAGERGIVGIVDGTGRSRGIEPAEHPAHMGLFVRSGKATFTDLRRIKLDVPVKFAKHR